MQDLSTQTILWRGTEEHSFDVEKGRGSADSQIEREHSRDLVLEVPIELLPMFERLANLPPDGVKTGIGNAMDTVAAIYCESPEANPK